jgi:hypothetical protein
MIGRVALVTLLCASSIFAQDAAETRLMSAVWTAMKPALPFPETDRTGAVPIDGKTEPLWMVRPPEPGSMTIEVLANPLNDANQLRAERAMAQIQNNIESAQRRAAAQYDRAVAEAKRTGKSQEVDGVTLNDEGVAGQKIDAESHVTIEVASRQQSYAFEIASATESLSTTTIQDGRVVIGVPAGNYRDEGMGTDRYAEAQTFVFLGRIPPPQVRRVSKHSYEIIAAADVASMVVRLQGNEPLIADVLRKTDWNSLLELLK